MGDTARVPKAYLMGNNSETTATEKKAKIWKLEQLMGEGAWWQFKNKKMIWLKL